MVFELDVEHAVVGFDLFDALCLPQELRGEILLVHHPDGEVCPRLDAADDLLERTVEQEFAPFDDSDRRTQLGQFVQNVRADDDRLAHAAKFLQQLANLDPRARIEAARGFVEQQDFGVVQQDPRDAETLLHAAR